MNCRHCGNQLQLSFIDLGSAPPSNNYLTHDSLHLPELWLPLKVMVCESCWLVQTEDFSRPDDLFSDDYAYFSSFSTSWLEHAEHYVHDMIERFSIAQHSHVIEIAANDGYLLQYFQQAGIPCLGVEPTKSTATAAIQKGLTIIQDFFGEQLANKLIDKGQAADLIAANNVLAHTPDINDFVKGFNTLLKPEGVATFEFPHLLQLVKKAQFDTIYHEHYSYLSFHAITKIFSNNGLNIFDVEKLETHGGSLRVYAQRKDTTARECTQKVDNLLQEEHSSGITTSQFYTDFQVKAEHIKNDFIMFLIKARQEGLSVAAYGAAAKGNTLLNFAGVRSDLISYVVDRNPAKQGKFMPGSRIPIVNEEYLKKNQPDRIVILPWNLLAEIKEQLGYIRQWGGKFVTAVPQLEIF